MPVCPVRVVKNLAAGEIYLGADFCFTAPTTPMGRIGDTVYCDANRNGIQDTNETGLAGVVVKLVCKNAAGAVIGSAMATTDANGKYLFVDVPAGKCEVSVDPKTVPCPCIVPLCPLKVVKILGTGQTVLNVDFCFTTLLFDGHDDDDDDDDHDGDHEDDDDDDDQGDHSSHNGDGHKNKKGDRHDD
jgi:hypothetical protein